MPLTLYNTLTHSHEPFVPGDHSRISFYTCGPTVYDDAHIGNFRSFLAADLLRRWLENPLCELAGETDAERSRRERHGRTVTHVMNITDVGHMTDDAEGGEAGEDRMAVAGRRIAEAKKSGKLPAGSDVDPSDPYQIARFYERRFREDARNLGLKVSIEAERDETLHPKATAHVPGMINVIQRLIDTGHAYVVGAPGSRVVYFRVQSFGPYGRLSGNPLSNLREGQGGRVSAANQAGKEHPADFLLWKEDASHIMKWPSPWGAGYPGWHIECSVMSLRAMAPTPDETPSPSTLAVPGGQALIDVHSGGEDNIFPHHECEIAQSCCAFCAEPSLGSFARLWFHPRFLMVEGAKMSKSKGNFYVPRELCAPPEQGGKGLSWHALRLELISGHYRSQADFNLENVKRSAQKIERWRDLVRLAMSVPGETAWAGGPQRHHEFARAMNDDLNIWNALVAFEALLSPGTIALAAPGGATPTLPTAPWTHEQIADTLAAKPGTVLEWLAYVHRLDHVVGVIFVPGNAKIENDLGVWAGGLTPDPAVEALLRERRDARGAKDFKRSDQIRDQLAVMGYAIKDMAGGKVEVRRA